MCVSRGGVHSASYQRCHELRADRSANRVRQDAIDTCPGCSIEGPAIHAERRLQLIGVTATPERGADALVEHPTHRQLNHASVEQALCELIELSDGVEILRKAGRLELRVDAPKVVAFEGGVGAHAAAQQSAAQCSVAQRRNVVGTTVGEYLRLDTALEHVVRRLQHM